MAIDPNLFQVDDFSFPVGSGTSTPPASPTIAAVGSVLTITGSEIGSDNQVWYASSRPGAGTFPWIAGPSRTGDGVVDLGLDGGVYWIYVLSTTSGGTAVSNVFVAFISRFNGELEHTPADILRYLLIALGEGVLPSNWSAGLWPIANDTENQTPDAYITTYDTSASDDGRSLVTGETFQHYGVQIRVRAGSNSSAWVKCKRLQTVLDQAVINEVVAIGDARYLVAAVDTGNPLRIGADAPNSARRLVTMNCTVPIRQLA